MEYENFDSHLEEFENSDESNMDDFLFNDEIDIPSNGELADYPPEEYWNDILDDDDDAEIRRIHLDAFPWDDA